MSKIVGIDLGTTNSLVAAVDSGLPYVIADPEGRRLTPSVVHFPPGGPPVAGEQASRLRALKPAETVYSIKRFMGRRASEISPEDYLVRYPLAGAGAGPVTVALPGRAATPEEVSAEILKKLRCDAEAALGEPVDRAVITVPAYFNDAQRNATKKAGELAGFTVERIVNEPTAAALAYGLDKLREKSKIAVYDLGGGTFDISILELNEGVFQVLSTNGNTRLGGDDLDTRLVEYIMDRIRAAGGPDISSDPCALARAREAAEQAKIRLSTDQQAPIALPFIAPDFHFEFTLRRAELEDLTRDIIQRTRPHCLRSLADARLKPGDLDQVILVGGQTRMPLVRRIVAELFGCAEFETTAGPRLNTTQNPDEAVALGAAVQAEILAGGFKNVLLLDITPLSLGLETFGGLMNVLIPRNSTIPIKAGEMFTTAVDQQRQILIHVLQGERERAADNWSLGRFTLDVGPAPKGLPRLGVQFEIDASGILHVLARDTRSGAEKRVEIKSAVDVSDQAVERMVEQSVQHAFEDLRARQWIEARQLAGDTLAAARKALVDCAAEMEADCREQVGMAMRAVEEILAGENPATQTGDTSRLKGAISALDQASRPLAERLMDKAMDAMLRKRGVQASSLGTTFSRKEV